ncbi:MAG: hypothetical protein ACHQIF_08725 [Steroidobacterales bacterium]|jgi:hypothetical protein
MRELVIVVADLYLGPEPGLRMAPARAAAEAAIAGSRAGAAPDAAPGLEHLTRFGDKCMLTQGWRAWVACWLGLPQYAAAAPATVAAAAAAGLPVNGTVWLATPVHLVAGMTGVHSDRRSLLRLAASAAETLAASFADTFRGSGLDLHPLQSGELLLSGPAASAAAITTEPARLLLRPIAESLPAGEGATSLRRLGAEIEMWLHAHPLNEQRMRRGEPSVSTLWLWGGGPSVPAGGEVAQASAAAAFGSDAYVQGLWRLAGGESRPLPVDWAALIGEPRAPRALGVVEVAELLHAHSSWRLADAVAAIDRRLMAPALAALRQGRLDRLVLLANDRCLSLRAASRWRLWRHLRTVPRGVEGLA